MGTSGNLLSGTKVQGLNSRGILPLGLPGFAIVVAIFKASSLSLEMSGSMAVTLRLLSLDVTFLGGLCLLAVLHFRSNRFDVRVVLKIMLTLLVGFYTIHSFVLLALDEYMNLFDLGRYMHEWQVVLSFFDFLIIAVVLVFVVSVFLNIRPGSRFVKSLTVTALIAMLSGPLFQLNAPFQIQKYAVLQIDKIADQFVVQRGSSSYTSDELEFYASAGPGPVEFIDTDPNIILLIVESLSSINSLRVSGERDLLGGFDQLSDHGVLFKNFFANHSASEGGIISFLSGFPPLHYPGATPLMFDEFANQSSVISEYRQRGYFTEFLTNTDLGFIGMDRYISGLRFDLARGRDEVPAFLEAPAIVQNAPSDRFLYSEALSRVNQLNQQNDDKGRPWFMSVATVSTHLPYTHPEGGEDSAQAVWAWSLERMQEFYDGLQEQGFFDNGILLISGDHRQMRPLTRQETVRYGDSAKARIPLLVIGDGYPAGVIDERYFQQSDLLRLLGRIEDRESDLSPQPIWVERYNRIYGKVDSINRIGVFDSFSQGMVEAPVRIVGTEFSWINDKPLYFRSIEAKVHAQRSLHQFVRSGGKPGCSNDFQPWAEVPSAETGVQLTVSETTYRYRAYLQIDEPGLYWFRTEQHNRVCLGIDQQLVVDQLNPGAGTQGSIELDVGVHEFELNFLLPAGTAESDQRTFSVQWVPPGLSRWRWIDIPAERLIHPENKPSPVAGGSD